MEIDGVKLEWTGHSGFLISVVNGVTKRIFIDPYNLSENVVREKADIILITHGHYDHCSIKDIERIVREKTVIVGPADVQSKITKIENVEMQIVEPGDEIEVSNLKIETIPAYNNDKEFHTKRDNFVGYLVKTKKAIIYHSGDSDKINEMEKLTGYGKHGNNFIVLLPVSGKYVMNYEEAADAAALINADIAIPMHYGAGVAGTIQDAENFVKLCKEKGIHAELLEKI
jgi:L-ascorbate metabolism protein UlaG (beta-lactamase superfamily)